MTTLIIPTDAPSVHGPPQGRWTYRDWEVLPDDGMRYEIIDGVLYMTTAPSNLHQWIIQNLYDFLGAPTKQQKLGYAFFAPIGVLMPGCDPVQPDFVVVLRANAHIIRDRRIFGVPDLIVEVLSPSNSTYDTDIKLEAYARAAVPEYAIVDPRTRTVMRYSLLAPGTFSVPQTFGEGDTAMFECLPTFAVPVGELFAGAPDTSL
jgi:Uma2 family endonuclease